MLPSLAPLVRAPLKHTAPNIERSTFAHSMSELGFVRLAPAARAFASAKIVASYSSFLAALAAAQPRSPRCIFVAAISPNNRQVSEHLPGHVFHLRVSSHVASKFCGQE